MVEENAEKIHYHSSTAIADKEDYEHKICSNFFRKNKTQVSGLVGIK